MITEARKKKGEEEVDVREEEKADERKCRALEKFCATKVVGEAKKKKKKKS